MGKSCSGLLAALLCATTVTAAAQAVPIVQVGVDSANPPFMYGSSTMARGLYPGLLAAAFAEMGEPVMITALPWKRVILAVDDGQAGAAGIYRNAERAKKYDFSEPIFVERIGVYYNSKKPVAFRSIADLHGLRVGVIMGWSYGDAFDQARLGGKFSVEAVPSDLQNLGKLELSRIDVALMIVDAAPVVLANKGVQTVLRCERLLAENATYLAFNKGNKRAALLDKFNAAMGELRASGAYAAIVARELAPPAN